MNDRGQSIEAVYTRAVRHFGWLMLVFLYAQAQSYKPSCTEALSFSPGVFVQLFTVLNGDDSEAGYDRAAQYWANCKRQENLRRLEGYPKLRARLEELRKLYFNLRSLETDIAMAYYGGGTLYAHALARIGIEIENHISDLISLTTRPLGATQAPIFTSTYDQGAMRMEEYILGLRNIPLQDQGQPSRAEWNKIIDQYESAYRSILRIAGPRKDITSATVLSFVSDVLWIRDILRNP